MASPGSTNIIIIAGDPSPYYATLNRVKAASDSTAASIGQKFQSVGKGLTTLGRSMTRNVTLPIIGIGVAAGKMALDFDTAFTRIAALSNASAKEIASWKKEVQDLAVATGKSPQELADALLPLASAGLKAGQEMEVLAASAKASAAGMGLTTDIARLTANALNAYEKSGLKAVKVTDILTAAVREGSAEPDEFADALGRILPIASKAGVSFDEVTASLASLSNIGLDVNEGVTAMRGLLMALEAPGTQAAETLKDVGISTDQMREAISEQGILGALRLLEERTGGNIDTMRKIVPNVRALTGQFGLLGQNAKDVDASFDRVKHSTGDLNKAFGETKQSPAFKLQQDLAKLKVNAIELGRKLIPIAKDVMNVVGDLADWFGKLDDAMQDNIIKWGLLAAAIGPVMSVLGPLLKGGGKAIGALSRLGAGAAAASGAGALVKGGAVAGGGALATTVGGAAPLVGVAAAGAAGSAWLGDRFRENAQEDAEVIKLFGTNAASAADAMERLSSVGNKVGRFLHGHFGDQEENLAAQHREYIESLTGSTAAAADFTLATQDVNNLTLQQGKRLALAFGAIRKFGVGLSETRQQQVKNMLVQEDFGAAMDILNGVLDRVVNNHKHLGRSLEVTGSRADGTAKHVGHYIDTLGDIPPSKTTTIRLNDQAAVSKLRNYLTTIQGVPAVLQTQLINTVKTVTIPGKPDLTADYGARVRGPALVSIGNIVEDVTFTPRTGPGARRGGWQQSGGGDSKVVIQAQGSWFSAGMDGAREFAGFLDAALRERAVLTPGF